MTWDRVWFRINNAVSRYGVDLITVDCGPHAGMDTSSQWAMHDHMLSLLYCLTAREHHRRRERLLYHRNS
jgi:hypothetical protein